MVRLKLNGHTVRIPTKLSEMSWQDLLALSSLNAHEKLSYLCQKDVPTTVNIPVPIRLLLERISIPDSTQESQQDQDNH